MDEELTRDLQKSWHEIKFAPNDVVGEMKPDRDNGRRRRIVKDDGA